MNNPNRPPQGGYRQGGQSRSSSEGPKAVPLQKHEFNFRDKDTFLETAETAGKRWSKEGVGTPTNQIRKFFGEVRRIEQEIGPKGEHWESKKLEFKLLKAKGAYALRDKREQKEDLVNFLTWGVDGVDSFEDFKLFVKYFEAAVGFAYGHGLKDN